MSVKIQQKMDNLGNALIQLKSALEEPIDKKMIVVDGTIQRFEFCYELFWKTLKAFLEKEGIEAAATPKQVFQEAYRVSWIKDEPMWLQMMRDRNTSSHVYDKAVALEIYQRVIKYSSIMEETYKKLIALLRKTKL